MLNIPTPARVAGDWTQRTSLGGVEYQLRYAHNSRTDTWTLDISAIGDSGVDAVMTGKKIFIGNDLLRYCLHPRRPTGTLVALSADGSRTAPGKDDLGGRVKIFYLAAGERFPSNG